MQSETFGELIWRLRKARGLESRDLALTLRCDVDTLSAIENNEQPAPEVWLQPLAQALGGDLRTLTIKYYSERVYYLLKGKDCALEALDIAKMRLERAVNGALEPLGKSQLLDRVQDYLIEQPIDQAWLFGSFARNEESYDSDLDLLVRFSRKHTLDLLDYIGIKQDLEALTGRRVDLVEEGYLLPAARAKIEAEKILIYERKTG